MIILDNFICVIIYLGVRGLISFKEELNVYFRTLKTISFNIMIIEWMISFLRGEFAKGKTIIAICRMYIVHRI